jgi:hypothetical protein
MYIISKYRDYYDGAVGMGIDKTIVYDRHFKSMPIPTHIKEKLREKEYWYSWFTHQHHSQIPKGKYNTYLIVIGFCGKLYPAIKTQKHIYRNYSYDSVYDIMYDVDEIKAFMDKHQRKTKYFRDSKTDAQYFEEYLDKIKGVDVLEIHREFNSPIFAWGYPPVEIPSHGFERDYGEDFYINPILKDYSFAKIFDPYTAFQEIQMFISGVMPVGDNVEPLPSTEKQKVAQHGMDKWSFRKPPEK